MSIQDEPLTEPTPTGPKLGFVSTPGKSGKAPKSNEPPPFNDKTYTTHIAMKLTENASFAAKTFANEVEIGRWLRAAQEALNGGFTQWVEDHFSTNFHMSVRTAWNYMAKADNMKTYGQNVAMNRPGFAGGLFV